MRKYLKSSIYLVVALNISLATAGPQEDFFHAVEVDAENVVSSLLKRGFDPNVRDAKGQVGLYLALRGDSRQVAEVLLKHPGVDIDRANDQGETPVMMAALRGDVELTRRLLTLGAKINRDGWTPLHYAASGPQPEVLGLLVQYGAMLDARSPNGTTPLMMAARYGAIDGADLLLKLGADRTLKNQLGMTAADFAEGAGRESLVQRLQVR